MGAALFPMLSLAICLAFIFGFFIRRTDSTSKCVIFLSDFLTLIYFKIKKTYKIILIDYNEVLKVHLRLDFVMRFILSITADINAKISVHHYCYRLILIIYICTLR